MLPDLNKDYFYWISQRFMIKFIIHITFWIAARWHNRLSYSNAAIRTSFVSYVWRNLVFWRLDISLKVSRRCVRKLKLKGSWFHVQLSAYVTKLNRGIYRIWLFRFKKKNTGKSVISSTCWVLLVYMWDTIVVKWSVRLDYDEKRVNDKSWLDYV